MRFEPILFVVLLAVAGAAFGQVPPARNALECDFVAELVLTARALDKHGITGDQADSLMAHFYAQKLSEPAAPRVAIYIRAARSLAEREAGKEPLNLAMEVAGKCNAARGNLTSVFGTDL